MSDNLLEKDLQNHRLRILFLGNSYTFFQSLPRRFKRLAQLNHKLVFVDYNAVGGAILKEHLEQKSQISVEQYNEIKLHNSDLGTYEELISIVNSKLAKSIDKLTNSDWDYVILQEQSQIPAIEEQRKTLMYPTIQKLDALIQKQKAKTVLFSTWGDKQEKLRPGPYSNSVEMFRKVEIGYQNIGEKIGALIIPAGRAWQDALQVDKDLDLWEIDGAHPSLIGQHLNMYLIYNVIFHEKPNIMFHSPIIKKDVAKKLVEIAWKSYNKNP
jgi:hypothetical protein